MSLGSLAVCTSCPMAVPVAEVRRDDTGAAICPSCASQLYGPLPVFQSAIVGVPH